MVQEDLRPAVILGKEAFLNAITVDLAIGGSTNAILHLLALAREVGIELTMADFDAVSRNVSCICAVRPNGPYDMVDFHEAGGVPVIQKVLEPLLETSTIGVGGTHLADILKGASPQPGAVIHALQDPVHPGSGLAILKVNLAPDGAIIRPSGVPNGMHRFQGPARIFEKEDQAIGAMKNGWKQPESKVKSGWLALYAANCRPASEGAAMQPWQI
jgi:dihydroxy-acid dehydratase